MSNALTFREQRDSATRHIIVDALQSHCSIRAAARTLKITDATLHYQMRRLGISVRAIRSMSVAA